MAKKSFITLIVTFFILFIIYLFFNKNRQNNAPQINNLANNFSIDDVKKHNNKNDCYLVIDSKVYNVTSFLNSHPGGKEVIIENCGNDVSNEFNKKHSNNAKEMIKNFQVGNLF